MNPFYPGFKGRLEDLADKEENPVEGLGGYMFSVLGSMGSLSEQVQEAVFDFHLATGKQPTYVYLGELQWRAAEYAARQEIAELTIHGIPCYPAKDLGSFVGVGV